MLLSTKNVAMYAAIRPNKTKSMVATNPWKELFATSLNVLFANLHPTEAPKINKQKFIDASGNLYVAMSDICKTPLATSVPDNSAAGTLNLSKKNMNTNETIINIINSQWFWDM